MVANEVRRSPVKARTYSMTDIRGNTLNSSIVALLVNISKTDQNWECLRVMRGCARRWGAGMAENGWWDHRNDVWLLICLAGITRLTPPSGSYVTL